MTVATHQPETTAGHDEPPAVSGGRRRRWFRILLIVALMSAGLGLLGILAPKQETGVPLDPDGVGPTGGAALRSVLEQQGVQVQVARSIQDVERATLGPDTSVFLADPNGLSPGAMYRFTRASTEVGTVVIAGPAREAALSFGLNVSVTSLQLSSVLGVCSGPLARPGDAVSQADTWYGTKEQHLGCFPAPTLDQGATPRSALLTIGPSDTRPEITLVGIDGSWRNAAIAKDANAAVALRTLGQHPRLLWYQPGESDAQVSFPGVAADRIAPAWLSPLVILAFIAVAALALARGRRFGALVGEDLPQVVPAAEVTLARGRLYAKSKDRERVAAVLRRGTIDRVSRRLSVSTEKDLTSALASATGHPPDDITHALFGPAPTSDEQLRSLAARLTDLEKGINHS